MYGLRGGSETIFSRKLAVTVDSLGFFLPVLVSFQMDCTTPPVPGALFLGGGGLEVNPPYFGVGTSKNYVSEKVGTVGELHEGKIIQKWGRASMLIGCYPEW